MRGAIFRNKIKTGFIVAFIFALLSAVIYFVSAWLGMDYRSAAVLAIGFSVLMSVGSYWFSDKMVLKMSGAHEPTPVQMDLLRPIVERVSREADIPVPRIYVTNDGAPNAFATGRNPSHAVVCVTAGLIGRLDARQLEGVIAHEIAHIKNYDILLQTVASVMIGAAMMAANMFGRSMLWGGGRRRSRDNDSGNIIALLIGLVCVILAPVAGQLMRMALSRNREYLADATGASFTGNPEGLASALLTIEKYASPIKGAGEATEGMYISNPLKAADGGMKRIFSTHPPIEERVKRLREMTD